MRKRKIINFIIMASLFSVMLCSCTAKPEKVESNVSNAVYHFADKDILVEADRDSKYKPLFRTGTVELYDEDPVVLSEPIAYGTFISEEEYQENFKKYEEETDSQRQQDEIRFSDKEEETNNCVVQVDDDIYFFIQADKYDNHKNPIDFDDVCSKFQIQVED